jgi:hypothetical protein
LGGDVHVIMVVQRRRGSNCGKGFCGWFGGCTSVGAGAKALNKETEKTG